MYVFQIDAKTNNAIVEVFNRYRVAISLDAIPPTGEAQLSLEIYPIINGIASEEPCEIFSVDEDRIIELEEAAREAQR